MQNELNAISDHTMEFLPLIDKALKSEKIIEILDFYDMKVVYEFDRLFEGTDDEYQSRSSKDGFEFIFDATQRLATVFLYIKPRGAFAAVDAASMDVPAYESVEAARVGFERNGHAIRQGDGWIKASAAGAWRHYEFRDGQLSMITIMRDPV
jgi:hypothetical protein